MLISLFSRPHGAHILLDFFQSLDMFLHEVLSGERRVEDNDRSPAKEKELLRTTNVSLRILDPSLKGVWLERRTLFRCRNA